MAEASTLLAKLMNLSEERLGAAVGDILSSDRFLKAVERAVSSGAVARGAVERGASRILGLLNVPTLDDLVVVERKLEDLEELIADSMREVDRIERVLKARKTGARKRSGSAGRGP